jgi:CubicO group peptidase (beta-lactamase class C family)
MKSRMYRVMIACMLLGSLVLAVSPLSAQVASLSTAPDFAAIDTYVSLQMQDAGIPGLALGIVHGNQVVHLRGFGVADPNGRVVTPQTPFIIGSTSKSFTALAAMQLVEAGKIDLDTPVQHYIPWFRVADLTASAQITVRHLLNQTSGFS